MEDFEANKKKICDISDILEAFRKYQIVQYLLIFLPEIFLTQISINYVFTVGDVNYRCRIDQCEDTNSTAEFPPWWPDKNIDRCSAPVLRSGEEICTNESFTGQISSCDRWIYESNDSVIAELDLACQPWKINMVGSIHGLGILVSLLLFGWVSDRWCCFVRKPVLIICIVAGTVGSLKTFATTYYMYVIIEFLEAAVTAGFSAAAMVLLIEITGKKYRLLSGIIFSYGIYCGEFMLACTAMFITNWRKFIYIIYGPCIFFIFLIFFINESPRWQIVSGRIEKAKKTMKQIADINNITINVEELNKTDEQTLREKFNIGKNEVKESLIDAFKSKEIMKRLFVVSICRFTCCFVYNGMLINSVWLPGDKYVNFLLTTIMSFPGELIALYLMNKIGRRIPLLSGFILSGILCVISVVIPIKYLWAKLTFFLIAKMIMSSCFTGVITYSMELFPTSARGSLLGITAFCSRIGAMLAPLSPVLITISNIHPFLIFACSSILSGLLLCLTPETKDLPLFDTIKQVESYAKPQQQEQQTRL